MNKNKLKEYIPVVYDNNFSYIEYKKLVNKYAEKDSRELNFQNRVIICMLEKFLINTDIEVVDTSTLYHRYKRNSKTIDNSQFTGKNSNGKYLAPPDLLLVRNWNIDNVNNKVEYIAAIEVKSPKAPEKIWGKKFGKYYERIRKEVRAHLSVHSKVILTDCYRWQFFNSKDGFIDMPSIELVDKNGRWKYSARELDEFVTGCLKTENNIIIDAPNEWDQLQEELLSFLEIN